MKGLNRPWALAFLPNGDMLILGAWRPPQDRPGRRAGSRAARRHPGGVHASRKGLMDIALHPRFEQNQFVYFTYHKASPKHRLAATTVLARGKFEGRGALVEVRDLFVADADYMGAAQTSRILFAPDGKLYMVVGVPGRYEVGTADARRTRPTTTARCCGSTTTDGPRRQSVREYAGPPPEIFALGIRNSNGLALHPDTGRIVGDRERAAGRRRVNIIRAGRNYGWPVVSYGRDYSGELTGAAPDRMEYSDRRKASRTPFSSGVRRSLRPVDVLHRRPLPELNGDLFVGALRGFEIQRLIFTTAAFWCASSRCCAS